MEKLHNLLVDYNASHIPTHCRRSWSDQFLEPLFPRYWYEVFNIVNKLPRDMRVIEMGCGQGDVTSIFCYLGFSSIAAFERETDMFRVAESKIQSLFCTKGIIYNESFPCKKKIDADILVIVNCVFSEGCNTKEGYMRHIKSVFEQAGSPRLFLYEAIDPSYDIPDENFPYHIRLGEKDIEKMFPHAAISSVETYRYPVNKRTKRLYTIKHQI